MTTKGNGPSINRPHDRLSAELLITSECNMACAYCIAKELPQATLNIEDGQKAIDLFIQLAIGASSVEITLTGGEPFTVFPLVEKLIAHAEKQTQAAGMDVSFILKTNGTILNDTILDFICAHQLKIVVSIDGPACIHNMYRLTKQHYPTYSSVVNTITELLEHNVQCVASVTVHPDACSTVLNTVRHLHDMGVEHIDVGPAYGTVDWSKANTGAFVDSLLNIGHYMRQVHSAGNHLEVGPLYQESEHLGAVLKDSWGCHAASTNLAFMPNGQIAGCSSLAMISKRYPELVIGDIASGINADALEQFLILAQANIDQRPLCQKCYTAANCTGGCLAINLSQNSLPFTPPYFYCQTISMIPTAWKNAWDKATPCH